MSCPVTSKWLGSNLLDGRAREPLPRRGSRSLRWRDSELYQGSRIGTQYSNVKVTGEARVGERETYVITGTSPEQTREEFFFDVQSGLLLRRHILEQTVFGGFQIQADFDDYREVGGVKMAFIVRWSSPGGAWGTKTSLKILEVRQNEPIGDDKFDGPLPKSP